MAELFDSVIVDVAKLRDYCLSETHARGRHKARVLKSRLGLTVGDAAFLQQTLIEAAKGSVEKLYPTDRDQHGQRYLLDFELQTSHGAAMLRSAWIVLKGENVLRFVSCYVL